MGEERPVVQGKAQHVALLCSDAHFEQRITRALFPVLGTGLAPATFNANCSATLLIVAERDLSALAHSVKLARKSGFLKSLLAVATDSNPAAIVWVVLAGADDYMSADRMAELPYRAAVLLGRESGLLKDQSAPIAPARLFADIEALAPLAAHGQPDFNLRTAWVEGRQVTLTLREFQFLQYLRSRSHSWVRAEELLSAVCGCPAHLDGRLVRVHMCSLRKKLGADGKLLESRRTFGYRWVGACYDHGSYGLTQS